jgi:hypothetical protein
MPEPAVAAEAANLAGLGRPQTGTETWALAPDLPPGPISFQPKRFVKVQ